MQRRASSWRGAGKAPVGQLSRQARQEPWGLHEMHVSDCELGEVRQRAVVQMDACPPPPLGVVREEDEEEEAAY